MSNIVPYSEQSPEFSEMLKQAEAGLDGGIAAFAASNCYMYGSSQFCKDWYECFVLNKMTPEEYLSLKQARKSMYRQVLNLRTP